MTDSDLRQLERLYPHSHGICDAAHGTCWTPACRCRCHRWAREVLAYLAADRARQDQRLRDARANGPQIQINMGPQPQPERDRQDAARLEAHRRRHRAG